MNDAFYRLDGKVAIVTGASRGIGEAAARAMAERGARVVLASRKQDGLDLVAERIEEAGGEALAVACHTGKPDEVDALVATAIDAFGGVDIVFNNAATNPYYGPMLELEWAAWEKTFEVNVRGYFAMSRAVSRHLLERRVPGSIIHNASVLGLVGSPDQGIYAMTKAAVLSMTRTLALELGAAGIRVNAIAPGLVATRFASAMVEDEALRDSIVDRTALGRIGSPEDIVGAVVFLASEASRYVTGQTLVVDGGWLAGA